MNWRELLLEPEGANYIYKIYKTPHKEGVNANIVDIVDIVEVSRPHRGVVERAMLEFRRLKRRLERIMRPGYLKWTAENHPELQGEISRAYEAFDTAERLESLKAGRIQFNDYRRLMLKWARLNVKAIKRHRRWLMELAVERAAILEFDTGISRQEADRLSGFDNSKRRNCNV